MPDKIVVEKEVVPVESGGSRTASSAIWAVALVIIVGLIVGALYYSGALRRLGVGPAPTKVDVKIDAPALPSAPSR